MEKHLPGFPVFSCLPNEKLIWPILLLWFQLFLWTIGFKIKCTVCIHFSLWLAFSYMAYSLHTTLHCAGIYLQFHTANFWVQLAFRFCWRTAHFESTHIFLFKGLSSYTWFVLSSLLNFCIQLCRLECIRRPNVHNLSCSVFLIPNSVTNFISFGSILKALFLLPPLNMSSRFQGEWSTCPSLDFSWMKAHNWLTPGLIPVLLHCNGFKRSC